MKTLFPTVSLSLAMLAGCTPGLDDELRTDDGREGSDAEQFEQSLDPSDGSGDEPTVLPGANELLTTPDSEVTVAEALNLAIQKPTSQSSTAFGGDSSRAVDGNTDGLFWNQSVTHTATGPSWWQVDLLAVEPVGEVVIHNRSDCCSELLHDFDISVSQDGVTWETFARPGPANAINRVAIDRPARYVRIANPDVLHMAEVEVLRTRNLAYGKPTSQSSTAFGGDSGRAVDGNTNGHWNSGTLSHTDYGIGEWWQVDLEEIENVGYIALFNRTDCCIEQLNNFTLRVSNDGQNWHDIPFLGSATEPTMILPVNREARFLRIENAEGYLHLAEVQVIEGTRLPGLSYGRGVGTIPSQLCGPGDELDAGLCYQTCNPGYRGVGPLCWQDCASGYTDMGLYCIDYGTEGWPSYWKNSYGRGAGSIPSSACGDNEYDAGLCYIPCTSGYHGVGPVCWLDDISIEAVAESACGLLRQPFLSDLAQHTNASLTLGTGLGLSAGASATAELGVAYGEQGEFGCYVSTCVGGESAVGISAYAVMARYFGYENIAGTSVVVSDGFSPVGLPPFSAGGEIGQITANGEIIGTSLSMGLSAGYSTPISLGALECTTDVLNID